MMKRSWHGDVCRGYSWWNDHDMVTCVVAILDETIMTWSRVSRLFLMKRSWHGHVCRGYWWNDHDMVTCVIIIKRPYVYRTSRDTTNSPTVYPSVPSCSLVACQTWQIQNCDLHQNVRVLHTDTASHQVHPALKHTSHTSPTNTQTSTSISTSVSSFLSQSSQKNRQLSWC